MNDFQIDPKKLRAIGCHWVFFAALTDTECLAQTDDDPDMEDYSMIYFAFKFSSEANKRAFFALCGEGGRSTPCPLDSITLVEKSRVKTYSPLEEVLPEDVMVEVRKGVAQAAIDNTPGIKLYWVISPDHSEDWFALAKSRTEAGSFLDDAADYDDGDCTAEPILVVPVLPHSPKIQRTRIFHAMPSWKISPRLDLKVLGGGHPKDSPAWKAHICRRRIGTGDQHHP
ncbi:MAG TPA: hypothetical protein VMU26_10965 [Candidatus Polarisedimenticolia bacterium]|nr:hypothetical protein [Candidatus Polarisedimenticolia bacterium]